MPEENDKKHNAFLNILGLSCIAIIIVSFYFFYFKKDYDFIVETSCDHESETCFFQDCSIEGNCPPNNLTYYNEYTISAKDFSACTNEDCTQACKEGNIECVKTECTDSDLEEGTCVASEPPLVLEPVAIPVIKTNTKSKN
jgi:hypothetical protein